ncbi:MAG: cytochrome C [Pseudomonadota bacterium]
MIKWLSHGLTVSLLVIGTVHADERLTASIEQGRYLVRLLGCEACHTNGYLTGTNAQGEPLSGSRVGLAVLVFPDKSPAVLFPSNLTPDDETGLGGWSRSDIVKTLTSGVDRHGKLLWPIMPWTTLSELKVSDAEAIADFLQSLEPVGHKVPDNVPPGEVSEDDYVIFMMEAEFEVYEQ